MDQTALRWPNPASLPHGERRRAVRQKLHSPVYVSFNTPQSGVVVDLSELLDLHEGGFAVQTAVPHGSQKDTRLEVNHAVTLCLDLSETKKYVHGSGQVMWTDDAGRAGVRFSFLPDGARQVLKEWLFANLLIASANHAARAAQLARHNEEQASSLVTGAQKPPLSGISADDSPSAPTPVAMAAPAAAVMPVRVPDAPAAEVSDQGELLTALDDVRCEVRDIESRESEARGAGDRETAAGTLTAGSDADAVLHVLTLRAISLTGASGAALALLTEGKMICRASAGEPAPPLSSEVDTRSGLSGECIRSGRLVACENSEADPRVDPEVCRMLGIGSFMAAPIFKDFRVAGLLEVFSPYPRTFTDIHGTILERLVELVPRETGTVARKWERSSPAVAATAGPAAVVRNQTGANASTPISNHPAVDFVVCTREDAVVPPPAQTTQATAHDLPRQSSKEEITVPLSRQPRLAHFILLVLIFGTIALVMGYLLAPTIERHWMSSARSAEATGQNVLARSKPASEQDSSQPAADRRSHALSADELRKLADRGDADAQWQLGVLYHDGDTVPKDDAQAVKWFERAAEQGYVRAQSTLGAYYWAGRGVPQDFSKAYFWSQLALAQGDENSRSRLEGLSAQMTREQVAQARQQAELWLHSHTQGAKPSPQ